MAIRPMPPTLSYRVVKAIDLWLQANRCSGLSMRVACGPLAGQAPKWLGVMTGTWRNHHRLVPATDDSETSTGTVTIPWTREQVGAAPEYDEPDQPISEKLEQAAYRHYRREPAATT